MDTLNQAKRLIGLAQNIFIIPSKNIQGDVLGSSLALFYVLKKLGKNVNILLKEVPEKYQFLGELTKTFVISADTSDKELEEMRYEKNEKDLKIYLSLKKGEMAWKDFSFQAPFLFNPTQNLPNQAHLLITVGVSSLEETGKVFEENPNLFYKVPVLNIDHSISNEAFGEVNLIDVKCPTLAEIVINLIPKNLLEKNIATCLLTGIIFATQNFQNPRTQPQTLELASSLLEEGAEHQKIIHYLYKTKNVSQIRLLGKILENLNINQERNLHWATLTHQDFQEIGACSKDLQFAIEELKFSMWRLPSLLLLWENHGSAPLIKGVFYSEDKTVPQKILENFEGVSRGEGVLFLVREENLSLAKQKVLEVLNTL